MQLALLSQVVGLSPQRVAQLLKFGAFLNFSTGVEKRNIPRSFSEREFRRQQSARVKADATGFGEALSAVLRRRRERR